MRGGDKALDTSALFKREINVKDVDLTFKQRHEPRDQIPVTRCLPFVLEEFPSY